jgi:hypothetical protein
LVGEFSVRLAELAYAELFELCRVHAREAVIDAWLMLDPT